MSLTVNAKQYNYTRFMYLSTFTTNVLIDIFLYYICTYQHVLFIQLSTYYLCTYQHFLLSPRQHLLCECLSTSKPTIINLLKINNYYHVV